MMDFCERLFPYFYTSQFCHHRVLALKNYNSTLYAASVLNKVANPPLERKVRTKLLKQTNFACFLD